MTGLYILGVIILGGLAVLGVFAGPLASFLGMRESRKRGARDIF